MAFTFDPTLGSPTANSFTTVEYADDYNAGVLYGDAWAGAVLLTKQKALVTATRLIVRAVGTAWLGRVVAYTQGLPFPRYGVYYESGGLIVHTIVPTQLQDATAELARRLIEDAQLPDTPADTAGIKKVKAGSVEVEFEAGGSASVSPIPAAVLSMFGFLLGSVSGQTSVPVIRT